MKENILAIPSKGKFMDESLALLDKAGIPISFPGRKLTTEGYLPEVGNFTAALLRPKDIVSLVAQKQIPLGIVGLDTVEEYNFTEKIENWAYPTNPPKILLNLGIGQCRLALSAEIGVMKSLEDTTVERFLEQFLGRRVATSYPQISQEYMDRMAEQAGIEPRPWFYKRYLDGSVEASVALGMADAISDLIETGKSLKDNGLEELATLFNSEGVLVTNGLYKGDNRFIKTVESQIAKAL